MTWPAPPLGHPSLPHSPVFAQRKEEQGGGGGGVGVIAPSPSLQLIVLLTGWGEGGLVSYPGSTHAEDLVGLIK